MADVITLSDDDDDIECLTPVASPPEILKPSSSANQPGGHVATAHITVTKLNLESLGISARSTPIHNLPPPRHSTAPPILHPMRPPISMTPQQRVLLSAARNGKRPSPSPAPSIQRTRNNHNTPAAPSVYRGHYMFEATEGYEPSRRSTRNNQKKSIEGKFVCTYNPTVCYKLCGNVTDLVNHVWSHAAYDSPVGPPTKREIKEDPNADKSKKPGLIISRDSNIALEKMRTCGYCNAKFVSLYRKQVHYSQCHMRQEEPCDTVCNICETDFDAVPVFQAHMRKHISGDAPYNCTKCKYRTSVRSFFFEHFMEKHFNEALICPFCLYQEDLRPSTRRSKHIFVRSFIEHLKIHATGKQFRCLVCALSFNSRQDLEYHRSNDHTALNPLWQVKERPVLRPYKRSRWLKTSKIGDLQKRFFETDEGRRINDEVACKDNEERLGYDLTASGTTLYKCECGFNTWNGNRAASHFQKCRKVITTVERERHYSNFEGDPKEELDMFAVFPKLTKTEEETLAIRKEILRKLCISDDDKPIKPQPTAEDPVFAPIDDTLFLRELAKSSKFDQDGHFEKCLQAILLEEDDDE